MNQIIKYKCGRCNTVTIIKRIDEGKTPFTIICPICKTESFFLHSEKETEHSPIPKMFLFAPVSDIQLEQQVEWEMEYLNIDKEKLKESNVNLFQIQKDYAVKGYLLLAPSKEAIEEWKTDIANSKYNSYN